MDYSHLYEFLSQRRLAVLATTSANGTPESALMGIAVTAELEIVFDTLTSSRKYPNLIARPACSLVVGWENEETVQIEGIARAPLGAELQRYQERYFAVWPDGQNRMSWHNIAYFMVKPHWVRYSNFGSNPPQISEGIY
jgi:pyridoxine/pyridoxamine 5'-phosphate oxidase